MFRNNTVHLNPSLYNRFAEACNTRKRILSNHWSELFYEKVFMYIQEEIFKPLYCDNNGRPNFPVNILAGLEIIKELNSLTDEELYENYHFNELYQRALGVEDINEYSFELKTLYNFRAKVCAYESKMDKDIYMEIFKEERDRYIKELGIKTNIQRTDSVMISANIKRMNRFTLLHKTLSNLMKDILKESEMITSEELKELISQEEDSLYYKLTKSQVKEKTLKIAEYLYIYIERFKEDKKINQLQSYITALRVFNEQCNVKESKVEIKIPQEVSSGSVQNPADIDPTYRKKDGEEYQGYAAHIVETCNPENIVQVITHVDTVKNNVDDAAVLNENLHEIKKETELEIIVNDGLFVSSDVTDTCKELKIEQIATAIRGKEMSDDKLTSEDFVRSESGFIESCPEGNRPKSQTYNKEDDILKAKFDSKVCNTCKLKERCIAYKSEKQSQIEIDPHRKFLDKRQKELGSEQYLSLAKLRPNVEATVSQIKPKYLNGRILFRGLQKVGQRMVLKATAVNFKRYLAWILYFFYFFRIFQTFIRNLFTKFFSQKILSIL